jgi:hypothetical protein
LTACLTTRPRHRLRPVLRRGRHGFERTDRMKYTVNKTIWCTGRICGLFLALILAGFLVAQGQKPNDKSSVKRLTCQHGILKWRSDSLHIVGKPSRMSPSIISKSETLSTSKLFSLIEWKTPRTSTSAAETMFFSGVPD